MTRFARSFGVFFLVVNVGIAALWVAILHPGSPTVVGRASSYPVATHHPFSAQFRHSQSASVPPLAVPLMLVPGSVQYAPQIIGAAVIAPHGIRVAQLASVPQDLAGSMGAVFPSTTSPVNAPGRAPIAPRSPDLVGLSFSILSVIRYEGSGGTVFVSTGRPSAAAMSRGLGLGSDLYKLPDGSSAWTIQSMDPSSLNQVRWESNGLIITIASDLPIARLEALAETAIVR